MKSIDVKELRDLFSTNQEFAVIDTREEGDFSEGHLLMSSNLPYSRLPLLVEQAIPNKNTLIIVTNSESENIQRSITAILELGYRKVKTLQGGLEGWKHSGGKIFSGVNVPGKAFGEFIEHSCSTPSITAEELSKLLNSGETIHLLDSRTPEEHKSFCLPQAISCPGGELVMRAGDVFQSSDTKAIAVVHCAGRTRSIIGAQTLINAGAKVPVFALENGTLAWQFANFNLETGNENCLSFPTEEQLEEAKIRSDKMIQDFNIKQISGDELQNMESGDTCYKFDVRSRSEFDESHLHGFSHVPGGQLVQNIDRYVVTRNCPIVLSDSEGVRSKTTASWLWQMGFNNLAIIRSDQCDKNLIATSSPSASPSLEPSLSTHSALKLVESGSIIVVDIRSNVDFRRQHIHGAWFLHRGQLHRDLMRLPSGRDILLVGNEPDYERLVASDLHQLERKVFHYNGSIENWRDAGGNTSQGYENMASTANDVMLNPDDYDDKLLAEQEGRRYLAWEIELINQLDGDPAAPYINASQ